MVKYLVKCGANLQATNDKGLIPLTLALNACSNPKALEVARYLLRLEKDLSPYKEKFPEVVRFLVKKGANLNVSRAGETPLHLAASSGHKDVVSFLLSLLSLSNLRKLEKKEREKEKPLVSLEQISREFARRKVLKRFKKTLSGSLELSQIFFEFEG